MAKSSTSYGEEQGNTPGREGGDKPAVFKDRMREIASRRKTVERLEKAMQSEDDYVFLKAFNEVVNRGYGKAVETVEHSGTVVHEMRDEEREAKVLDILTTAKKRKERGVVS